VTKKSDDTEDMLNITCILMHDAMSKCFFTSSSQ